jgi:TolB-like protein/DNA-binding winged helix-turn-helix (wHTH) protein
MSTLPAPSKVLRFGIFEADPRNGELRKHGLRVKLHEQPFQVLVALLNHHDQVVTREELRQRLWPADTFVDFDNGLNGAINRLREALGDSAESPRFIETIPRRGYRFIGPVNGTSEAAAGTVTPGGTRRQGLWIAAVAVAGVLAVLGLNFRGLRDRLLGNPRPGPIQSIAVLPFKPIGADGSDEYLGVGIADALITKLSNIRQMAVRPTGSVLRYTKPEQDVQTAGRELKVDAVLAGSVQRAGERIRLTVQLISVRDGRPLWADTFDEQWTHIFAVQDAMSNQVARALALRLTGAERQRLVKRDTENPAAYQEYLLGRHYWTQFTPPQLKRALEHFQRAVELDPRYALAHAGIADSYTAFASYRVLPPTAAYPKARAAAAKALEFNPELSDANSALALVSLYHEWDWAAAERNFARAIALGPDNAEAHHRYALALVCFERFDEALREMARARELDPLSPRMNTNVGWILYMARRYDQAIRELGRALALDPNFFSTHQLLGWSYVQTGAYDQAIAEFKKAIDLGGGSQVKTDLAHAYAVSGQTRAAKKILDNLKDPSKQTYASPFDIAVVYAGLGDRDQAFEWLEKAYKERSRHILLLEVIPRLDPLRADPRFAMLMRRMRIFHVN